MLVQGWDWQWKRVGRRLEDVGDLYEGAPGGTDVAIDKVLAFFEAIHHLKDWLHNDPNVDPTVDGEALVRSSTILKISADLANASKHLKLDNPRADAEMTSNDVTVFAGTNTSAHRFRVEASGVMYDVLEIAERAVAEWQTFLSTHGLL